MKRHNNRKTVQQRAAEGTATRWNNGTMGGSKWTNHIRRVISRAHRLKKTSSEQSKHRNLHLKWLHRKTNGNKLYSWIYNDEQQQSFPRQNTYSWLEVRETHANESCKIAVLVLLLKQREFLSRSLSIVLQNWSKWELLSTLNYMKIKPLFVYTHLSEYNASVQTKQWSC